MATLPPYDPQKAILVAEPPSGPRWIHELKLDGYNPVTRKVTVEKDTPLTINETLNK